MRVFKKYNSLIIAKHINRLFKGKLYITGVGPFHFDNGKLLIPSNPIKQHYSVVAEVNQNVKKTKDS